MVRLHQTHLRRGVRGGVLGDRRGVVHDGRRGQGIVGGWGVLDGAVVEEEEVGLEEGSMYDGCSAPALAVLQRQLVRRGARGRGRGEQRGERGGLWRRLGGRLRRDEHRVGALRLRRERQRGRWLGTVRVAIGIAIGIAIGVVIGNAVDESISKDEGESAGGAVGGEAVDELVEDGGPAAHLGDVQHLHLRRDGGQGGGQQGAGGEEGVEGGGLEGRRKGEGREGGEGGGGGEELLCVSGW